ncbi:GspS/AspS pilotin family protein [Aliivibrio fischeri]|uniref:GspS/AspS pilotin family protein n=1 Tax=Aliivibrio fischeri TaxID=668 RepID=UPI001F1C0899|nr:GspS/AspS pilotin family protein [Aliivibrio fischeri]MCE7534570.1 GspS/AspS pilotin family protein [Aliivibrio fischeri]MCE7557594.1 GspS/AspS pilotin family protein [Aliivibrio fischeri]
MKKILLTAISAIILSGCASNEQQQEIEMLADYRASVLASVLPLEMGQLTLLQAKAKQGVVEMMFLDGGNGEISTNKIIENSITTFCKDKEVRPVLDKGVTYRYIIRNSRGQKQNDIIVNEQSCLDREQENEE